MASIPPSSLPAAVRETVTLTRRLGICYLWMDSLCISYGQCPEARRAWEMEFVKTAAFY